MLYIHTVVYIIQVFLTKFQLKKVVLSLTENVLKIVDSSDTIELLVLLPKTHFLSLHISSKTYNNCLHGIMVYVSVPPDVLSRILS